MTAKTTSAKVTRGIPFAKGNPGKPKGAVTKSTAAIKDMILMALDKAGGADYLARQAEETPAAFMALVGKVLPLQLTGKDGGAMVFEKIVREIVRPK